METELTKPDSFIETELKRFESIITKEQLITMADSVKDLVIKDTEDKAGLKAVIEGRKQLKFQRVRIKKEAEIIRESAVRFQKAVIAKQTELIDLIEPTETLLESREQEYYAERARLDALREKQESDRIQAMIDKLNAVNYAVDFHELKALTDVQFENILAEATTKYNVALEEEKAEKQRQYELRLQEETRLAQAQKEQEERELKFKEEQEAFRKQQEERQKLIDEENERIRKERDEELRKINEENERIRIEQEAKNKELADRERELERQEQERIEALAKEKREKEEAERKKQEEIDRKKREKEEKEQRLLFGEDTDRFRHIATQLSVLVDDVVWLNMKSKKGQEVAATIHEGLKLANELAERNSQTNGN